MKHLIMLSLVMMSTNAFAGRSNVIFQTEVTCVNQALAVHGLSLDGSGNTPIGAIRANGGLGADFNQPILGAGDRTQLLNCLNSELEKSGLCLASMPTDQEIAKTLTEQTTVEFAGYLSMITGSLTDGQCSK